MRSYFETTLRTHSQLRLRAAERRLQHDFRLSRRELQVLQMLVCGASNADISELMGVSLAASKTHLVNICDKLGVDNRSAAVAFAFHLQLQ
jgi:ATP/maltotriose-dependent transcriptional regulator MalT